MIPVLFALLAMVGGSMLFMYASSREEALDAAYRSLRAISGFAVAHNDLEREQERVIRPS